MSDYINTVDSMGDAALCNAIIEKTLSEITDTHCTTIGGYAFYKFSALRSAIFENAARIEQYAFAYCSDLETVVIPLAENVGYFSFYECTKLKRADFPNVKSVNRYAFNGCTVLETLALRSTTLATLLGTNALEDTLIASGKGYIYVPAALVDSYKADSKWSSYANQFRVLENYTVDGTITGELDTNRFRVRFFNGDTLLQESYVHYGEMPVYTGAEPTPEEDYAFVGWSPAISVVTGDVDYVAQFKYTKSVTRALLNKTITEYSSDTLTSVGKYVFSSSKLTSINMPNVTSVSDYAFQHCSKLASVNMPNVTSIGNSAFYYCSKLASIDLSNVTSIDDSAFIGCKALTSIDLPNVTRFGNSVFNACDKLASVNMPNVTSTGSSAFYYCSALTSIDLPNVTSVGDYAFYYCSKLASIDLSNVTSINGSAFNGCSALASVRLPATPPTLKNVSAFTNVPTTCVFYIPTGSLTAYQSATNWSSLTSTYSFVEENR